MQKQDDVHRGCAVMHVSVLLRSVSGGGADIWAKSGFKFSQLEMSKLTFSLVTEPPNKNSF